ncbi:MAG: hypothetical protein CME88_03600 [Hirschia sp.]|nr:hypothetical protein [Hirschia sp.]MBF17441.1 hypothetical protein [Hirschia sp.]
MDESAWRAVLVTTCLFVGVAIILLVGKSVILSGNEGGLIETLQAFLIDLRNSPFGMPVVVLVFCLAAFLGAPQFMLITAAVTAFGPLLGFAYAWLATTISMGLTFWVGRMAGEGTVRKYGGDIVNRFSSFVGKNDLLASAIVRNVPTAPFIIVNMAFGVSKARFWRFLIGGSLGSLPKHLLVAFGGQAVIKAIQGNMWMAAAAFAVSIFIWIPLMLFARRRVKGVEDDSASELTKTEAEKVESA